MPIQIKAGLLLLVFSLKMLTGFICALGIDRLFIPHHLEKTEMITHDGSHRQEGEGTHFKAKGSKDNSGNDDVIKISLGDKSLPPCFAGLNAIFVATLLSSFYNIDVLDTCDALVNIKYFIRCHHPPISDIRIAIRSFQI